MARIFLFLLGSSFSLPCLIKSAVNSVMWTILDCLEFSNLVPVMGETGASRKSAGPFIVSIYLMNHPPHVAAFSTDYPFNSEALGFRVSGGSSVGEQDFGSDILAERGEVLFHGIAVKPGKPTAFARTGTQLVLAMPGNPTSCLSNAYVLLRPLVRQLAGLPPLMPVTREASLTRALASPMDRLQFYPVRLDGDRAVPVFKGSGDVTSLSDADGYVEVPIGVARVEPGTRVVVTLY